MVVMVISHYSQNDYYGDITLIFGKLLTTIANIDVCVCACVRACVRACVCVYELVSPMTQDKQRERCLKCLEKGS